MNETEDTGSTARLSRIDVRLKLSALWTVYMFVYIYTDYYKMYIPGKIDEMNSGLYDDITMTDMTLLVISAITLIPAMMIFLTLVIKENINRWLNILLGLFHIAIGIIAIVDFNWPFWIFNCALLIGLATLIVVYSWRWRPQ